LTTPPIATTKITTAVTTTVTTTVTTVVTTTTATTTKQATTYISVSRHMSASSVIAFPSSDGKIGSNALIHWYLVALLLLLVILVIIICMLTMKHKAENQIRTRERSNDTMVHTPTVTAGDSVIYSTVSKPKSSASKVLDQDVTYSAVHFTSKEKS
ncbi:polymeric immunoglobulin receptor-like, partial [Clarias magur]